MRLRKYTQYSILGFKILNFWHSVISAYLFVFFEFLVTPYFGYEEVQYLSGLLFILLLNISVIILIINSCFRISKPYVYHVIFIIPLLLYLPSSLYKTIFALSRIKLLFV